MIRPRIIHTGRSPTLLERSSGVTMTDSIGQKYNSGNPGSEEYVYTMGRPETGTTPPPILKQWDRIRHKLSDLYISYKLQFDGHLVEAQRGDWKKYSFILGSVIALTVSSGHDSYLTK